MPAYKDKNGTWFASYFETLWTGERKRRVKRGFKTKREADAFIAQKLLVANRSLDMTFEDFVKVYYEDLNNRIKENTMVIKKYIVNDKILPYFKNLKMNQIRVSDVMQWQNQLLAFRDENGNGYSPVYLKTVHNILSAIFNHACNHYDLPSNPARKCGNMGKETNGEKQFWTKEEYLKFSEVMMKKDGYFQAFEILYWCGLRLGEMMALTVEDFDFERNILRINKSLQIIHGKVVITDPKTEKSKRSVLMPQFLADEIKDYIDRLYRTDSDDRIFHFTKTAIHNAMKNGAEEAGVKRIRIHDLRHSHVSLLMESGFSVLAIADRVGHESSKITYRYAHTYPLKDKEIADYLDFKRKEVKDNDSEK